MSQAYRNLWISKGGTEVGKKRYLIFAVAFVLAGNMSLAVAAVTRPAVGKRYDKTTGMCRELHFYNSGWVSKGHRLFRNHCKTCHNHNNNKGARFLYSESFTMEGWNRVFYKKNVKCAQDGSWGKLSQEQLSRVNDYLYWNAFGTYDANTAERCG